MGAILIVMGLYSVLWGKYKEYKEKELAEILDPVKPTSGNNKNDNITMVIDGVEDVEMQRNEAYRPSVPIIAISSSMPTPPMIAVEAPKV